MAADRYAARVGATVPEGVADLTPVVVAALEEELAASAELHGDVLVFTFPADQAARAMDDIGVAPDSPTRAFFREHAGAVLVAAIARIKPDPADPAPPAEPATYTGADGWARELPEEETDG